MLAVSLTDTLRLKRVMKRQGRAILAMDGLQPDVGHEVLWVIRECLSGEILLARRVEGRTDELAEVVQGYCAAVRSALTDDGRPPLEASGLRLQVRLSDIVSSLARAEKGRRCPRIS